jgi:hypothetical protein
MEILVDRSRLPKGMPLMLALDYDRRAFPLVDLRPNVGADERENSGIVFLDRTRVEADLVCCRGVLTLEKGSRFDCPPAARLGNVSVKGGEVILRDDGRFVDIREDIGVVRLEKQVNQLYPLALRATVPAEAQHGDSFVVSVAQRNGQGQTVGGATALLRVR